MTLATPRGANGQYILVRARYMKHLEDTVCCHSMFLKTLS